MVPRVVSALPPTSHHGSSRGETRAFSYGPRPLLVALPTAGRRAGLERALARALRRGERGAPERRAGPARGARGPPWPLGILSHHAIRQDLRRSLAALLSTTQFICCGGAPRICSGASEKCAHEGQRRSVAASLRCHGQGARDFFLGVALIEP